MVTGKVLTYAKEEDVVEIEFDTEKGLSYHYHVLSEFKDNNIKLARSVKENLQNYAEICEIGALVEMNWTAEDLAGTEWQPGQ